MTVGDASPVVLERVQRYTVGFARSAGNPAALGSGVLARIGDARGILTCAHVEEFLQETEGLIGVVGFTRPSAFQASLFDIRETSPLIWGSPPWTRDGPDLCFIRLTPNQADSLEARFVFLNADRNLQKYHKEEPSHDVVDAVCGLVDEFSGPTTRRDGMVTTRLRAVLEPGRIVEKDGLTTTLECLERNLSDLWRVNLRPTADGSPEIVEFRLRGIASWEDQDAKPPRIACQGLGRLARIVEQVHQGVG
jgi:hypothetical protein